ncbi:CRISPR-associated protein Cas5, N-terminal [Acididesulfobacillus acetoxydans]|uniref:CRISPR-associated protein Cas5, N-terminal n=1 Tax=Acididesulfobacillus acetoxydans TaxID=1561005 RepID=A0A8S0Y4B0_9FIRM|nr:CRISPR-associated protein Cas5 [Acididesulfobacillus acetoxydans]CAA7602825.1 CRISPR-associated protein Cas5, N-terminal [Acididesulfobacillus acetoxydans]CEJ05706.1 CRISPR-associated protein, Cas5h [Acididesulfobacillus acetoxydans]
MSELISFQLNGRFAHFLRAEAGASALSYPIPPRTVILGLIGAVLGLAKDSPQVVLEPCQVALTGEVPQGFWHKAKLRKDPPELLPHTIRRSQTETKTTKPEKATLIDQEWLFNPSYTLWVSLPQPHQAEFERRVRKRAWYFQPCMGLSEMMADITYLGTAAAKPLPPGLYDVTSVIRQGEGEIEVPQVLAKNLALHLLRMPRSVTADRVFTHDGYVLEKDGRPIPTRTSEGYEVDGKVIMFL